MRKQNRRRMEKMNTQSSNEKLKIYIAASFKQLHGVRLLGDELRRLGCEILDWTAKATPPAGLTAAQRRIWMDTDQDGGQVFEFCKNACVNADLIIYLGSSGQDAGVEVGMAAGAGKPVLGIRGPLESPGLMLHGAVTVWTEDARHAVSIVKDLLFLKQNPGMTFSEAQSSLAGKLAQMLQ